MHLQERFPFSWKFQHISCKCYWYYSRTTLAKSLYLIITEPQISLIFKTIRESKCWS